VLSPGSGPFRRPGGPSGKPAQPRPRSWGTRRLAHCRRSHVNPRNVPLKPGRRAGGCLPRPFHDPFPQPRPRTGVRSSTDEPGCSRQAGAHGQLWGPGRPGGPTGRGAGSSPAPAGEKRQGQATPRAARDGGEGDAEGAAGGGLAVGPQAAPSTSRSRTASLCSLRPEVSDSSSPRARERPKHGFSPRQGKRFP